MKRNFELYKLKRSIQKNGSSFVFRRPKTNSFGEKTKEYEENVYETKGIYHENVSYIKQKASEDAEWRSKKTPMILTSFDESINLNIGDVVKISDKDFLITGIENLRQENIICDISLEIILN